MRLTLGAGDRSPARVRTTGGLGAVAVVASVLLVLAALVRSGRVDLEVYRRAGSRWLVGVDPYAVRPELPFTYPPIGVALSGLVAASPTVALVVLAVLSAGSAAVAAAQATAVQHRPRGRVVSLAAAVALAVASEPVLRSVELGQVNGLVIGLVLLDQLVVPRRWRGWLTGLAAGLKLTPLAFVLIPLVCGERAATARLLGATASTMVLGAVLVPGSTTTYWSHLALDAGRVGNPGYVDNQSLLGAATRLAPALAGPLWVTGSAFAVVTAVIALRRARAGPRIQSVVVCALLAGLVSPISWSHHWLLLPAAAVMLWQRGHPVAAAAGAAALVTPWLALAGWQLPAVARLVVDNGVVAAGCLCLAVLARGPWQSGNGDPHLADVEDGARSPATATSPGGPTATLVARREPRDDDERRATLSPVGL